MRCRYCNKAISLLRRMNDAEFCSDAHRHSYAEEQQLAMRRLTETQPSLQRTQRVPAVQPVPAAPVSPSAAVRMVSMAIMGEFFPAGPHPVPPPSSSMPGPDPVIGRGTIQFVEREGRVAAGAPFSGRTVPVLLSPSNVAIQGAASPERPLPVRIVPPRRGNVSPGRNLQAVAARTGLRPLSAPAAGALPRPAVSLTPVPSAGLRALPAGHRRRSLLLPESRRLVSIPAVPAGLRPEPVRGERLESGPSARGGFALALPSAALAVIAPPPVETAPDVWPEVWETIEQSGLAALLAATGIAPVVAAPPPAHRLPVPAEPYEANLPEPEAHLVAAMRPVRSHSRLDAAVALRTVPAPVAAGRIAGPRVKPRPVAGPPARRVPVYSVVTRGLSLSAVTATCAVAPPPPAVAALDLAAAARPVPPSALPASALPSLLAAGTALVTYSRLHAMSRRGIFPVHPPSPRGVYAAPLAAAAPCAAAFVPKAPSVRLAPVLRRVASASRPVAVVLAPVDHRLAPRPFPAVPSSVEAGAPRHTSRMIVRSARAGCLRLAPPPPAVYAARPRPLAHVDLVPAPGVPAPALRALAPALRSRALRLFRVPNARFTPRDSRIRPLALGFDLWGSAPAICPAGLAWDDGKPRQKKSRRRPHLPGNPFSRFSSSGIVDVWAKVRRLPSDLKWIAMVVPLIIGIWAVARPSDEPAPRKVAETRVPPPAEVTADDRAIVSPVAAPVPIAKAEPAPPPVEAPVELPKEDRTAPVRPLPAANPSAWDSFTARVASRASVDLVEDFQKGLSLWDGRGEWARTWTYDRSGTVRPGQMAFFQPSVGLHDYVMEMKASIDRRVIQWLVRASGPQNYHFARLNVTPGAPLTKLEFERWSVVNGRTGRVTRLPLPHAGANQTLFDIRVEVKGDTITTYLQDQVIDTFSDPRLPEGGIGLVGAGDDRPRIYGLRVYHQNDFLGKLCSFFASPPIASQGSE